MGINEYMKGRMEEERRGRKRRQETQSEKDSPGRCMGIDCCEGGGREKRKMDGHRSGRGLTKAPSA